MFVTEVLHALRRLWYLVLCGAILAGGGAYYAWAHTEPRYTSEASVLLLPPASTTARAAPDGSNGNPLLYLGGLNQARDVLISAMAGPSEQEKFDALFPGTSYGVAVDPLSSGPIVVVSTDSATAAGASRGIEHLLQELTARFDEVQKELSVPDQSVIHTTQLTPPTTPEADAKPQLRAAVLAGAGILVVALLLVAVIDGLIRYARRTRRSRPEAEEAIADGEEAGWAADDPSELDLRVLGSKRP